MFLFKSGPANPAALQAESPFELSLHLCPRLSEVITVKHAVYQSVFSFFFVQAENSALSLENDNQRKQYERCLDEVSVTVLTALLW